MNPFRLLLRLRLRSLINTFQFATRGERSLLATFALGGIGLFVLVLTAGVALLQAARATGGDALLFSLVQRVAGFLFLFLLAGGIPFVASVLLSPGDLPLLSAAPVRPVVLVAGRVWDSLMAASGQFVVIGLPLLVACAVVLGVPLWTWPLIVLLLLLFTALPTLAIVLLVLGAARMLGVRRVRVVVMAASALLALAMCLFTVGEFGRRAEKTGGISVSSVLEGLQSQPAPPPYLPATWTANALVGLASEMPARAALPFLGIAGLTAILLFVSLRVGGSVLVGETLLEGDSGTNNGEHRLSLDKLLARLPAPMRALLTKDARYVLRDLVLISQVGIPVILYFVPFVLAGEARRRGASLDDVLLLALGIVATIVYMETSIFGLSAIGIEGRGFWILRGAPISPARLVWTKWLGAFLASFGIGVPLLVIACLAFGASPMTLITGLLSLAIACAALTGMGVGLGGIFPHFTYDNPAHRASLTALVLGFVGATVYVTLSGVCIGGGWFLAQQWPENANVVQGTGFVLFLLLSLLTNLIPLVLAQARLNAYAWEH